MRLELTEEQKKARAEFKSFVDDEIVPYADRFDREECTPPGLIKKMAERGYLGAILPQNYGGSNIDAIAYGLLNEEVARGSASLHSFLVVSSMVTRALLRWGTKSQKEYWLPKFASGEIIPAFCISELNAGSDTQNIETTAIPSGDSYVLNGHKRWSSYGQIADVFLVFAQCDGSPCAFLVEKNTPGLSIKPISGMVGMKAAMLAQVYLEDCRIPQENLVCKPGFGLSHVAYTALDQARYNIAWGCVGIAQACLEACLQYTSQRKQFGVYLKEHQLIRQMITEMIVKIKAARLLCYQAGYLKQISDPTSIMETLIAKYFASTMVTKVSSDAVQIHGAYGCSSDSPIQRYWRDAKIMEIVEGSTQLLQTIIPDYGYQENMKD
jgi:glutaryl-CoA dehydrogenase (non-decarboxylating)